MPIQRAIKKGRGRAEVPEGGVGACTGRVQLATLQHVGGCRFDWMPWMPALEDAHAGAKRRSVNWRGPATPAHETSSAKNLLVGVFSCPTPHHDICGSRSHLSRPA